MNIFNLIVYILISVSASHLWSYSEIFASLRNRVAKTPLLNKFLLCPECSSFWIGIFSSIFLINPFNSLIGIIYCGFINYIICIFLYKKNILGTQD